MPKEVIDLRSDTVTLPTQEMLEAVKNAKLGDDVYEEDPTVKQLQDLAAEKMGKEAALLVTSGTQANLISLMSNCNRGEQVFLEAQSHIYWYEVGGVSTVAGLFPWTIQANGSIFNPEQVEAAIRPSNIHYPSPSLVCVENTHNRYGGLIVTPNQLENLNKVAKKHGLKLYMDGARIFNAAVALKIDIKELTKHVDNLMFCLSKGLSCPIGSIIVGSQEFIDKARKNRKLLGGGMRQAGIIAAPGIVAMESMIDRLAEDHENAQYLAMKLSKIKHVTIDLSKVQTNIVTFFLDPSINSDLFVAKLKENNILGLTQSKNTIRLVTHRGIEHRQIERVSSVICEILERN